MANYHCPRGTTMYYGKVFNETENCIFEGNFYVTRSGDGRSEFVQFVKNNVEYFCKVKFYSGRPLCPRVKVLDPIS